MCVGLLTRWFVAEPFPEQIHRLMDVTMWRLAVFAIGNIGLSLLQYQLPPYIFVGITAPRREDRVKWMALLKRWWEALAELEREILAELIQEAEELEEVSGWLEMPKSRSFARAPGL